MTAQTKIDFADYDAKLADRAKQLAIWAKHYADDPKDPRCALSVLDLIQDIFDIDCEAAMECERENITRYGIDREGYALNYEGFPTDYKAWDSQRDREDEAQTRLRAKGLAA